MSMMGEDELELEDHTIRFTLFDDETISHQLMPLVMEGHPELFGKFSDLHHLLYKKKIGEWLKIHREIILTHTKSVLKKYEKEVELLQAIKIKFTICDDFSIRIYKPTSQKIELEVNFGDFLVQLLKSIRKNKAFDEKFISAYWLKGFNEEFIHWLDRDKIQLSFKYIDEYRKWVDDGKLSEDALKLFEWVYIIRIESVPILFHSFKELGYFLIDNTKLKRFVDVCEELVKGTCPPKYLVDNEETNHYQIGLSVINVCAVYFLIKEGLKKELHIIQGGNENGEKYPLKKFRDFYYSAERFGVQYGFSKTALQKSDPNVFRRLRLHIQGMNHLDFLEYYHESCNALGVKPLISATMYKKFQKRIYKRSQEEIDEFLYDL
tara:strand:+ start:214 stop:1347 length:1134 start_codon:yes stop_codon:yes gene_type:complete